MTPGAERVTTLHKLLNAAGYSAIYGFSVSKTVRLEGYNGPDRNLIVEYHWHGENVRIAIFHEYGVPVEFDKLAEWLKG